MRSQTPCIDASPTASADKKAGTSTGSSTRRRSALDRRTTRHVSYAISQRRRPLIEKVFGWLKPIGGLRKVKLRGLEKVGWLLQYAAAAYNLWRIPKLHAQTA